MDLSALFNAYGSDKDRNGYTALYHTLFDRIKAEPMNVAEIGIGTMIPGVCSSMVGYALPAYRPGGSLRAWRDYFSNSRIYGFDVQTDTQFEDERIQTRLCNSTNSLDVDKTVSSLGVMFDIIIDDGDHRAGSQYETLRNFYPYLKDGGIYVIEDIYPTSQVSNEPALLQTIVSDPYFFAGVKNNLCIIYKKPLVHKAVNF